MQHSRSKRGGGILVGKISGTGYGESYSVRGANWTRPEKRKMQVPAGSDKVLEKTEKKKKFQRIFAHSQGGGKEYASSGSLKSK